MTKNLFLKVILLAAQKHIFLQKACKSEPIKSRQEKINL